MAELAQNHPALPEGVVWQRSRLDALQGWRQTVCRAKPQASGTHRVALFPESSHLEEDEDNGNFEQGPGCNDNSLRERVVNVVTALPFLALSCSELRWAAAQLVSRLIEFCI